MFETFENLDNEKKNRILNAAMQVFAAQGYRQAATDDIVSRAEISKGALFHYFGNKETLYTYLLDFVISTYIAQISSKIDYNEPDFFARVRKNFANKLQLFSQYPALVSFWERAEHETCDAAINLFAKRADDIQQINRNFVSNVDFSRFKEDLDLPRTLKIIQWTFDQFSKEIVEKAIVSHTPIDWDMHYAEAEAYLQYFQAHFYKEIS